MRTAPAHRFDLRPSPAGRAAVACIAALAAASAAGWTGASVGWAAAATSAAVLAAAATAAVAAHVLQPRDPLTLDWDTRGWLLVTPGAAIVGEIVVAMDLGVWLLLRFRAFERPRHVRWIALGRRGHEAHWHALRCALYSPRLADGADAVAGDRPAAAPDSKNDRS